MYKLDLKSALNNYFPNDEDEKTYKNKMLLFLKTHKNCFDRSCIEGHFTSSCWLIDNTNNRALLMHHTKLNKWFQLGGHCDGNKNILEVSIQEAREESGIKNIEPVNKQIFDVDIHLIPQINQIKSHFHYDVRFLLQVKSNEVPLKNHESKELRWVYKNDNKLPTQNKSVLRMYNKWKNMDNDMLYKNKIDILSDIEK